MKGYDVATWLHVELSSVSVVRVMSLNGDGDVVTSLHYELHQERIRCRDIKC